jgi:cleavage stimulation factor subunit 3
LIIDRYKFLDLLPCSSTELKSMGYKEIKSQVSLSSSNATLNTQNQQKLINSPLTELNELNTIKLKTMYPLPDEMQMLPFKPVRNARKNILLIRINLLVKIFF